MTRFVALLRGINVGTAKRIAMADLRALLESMGYTQVKTLLNSGNATFTGLTRTPTAKMARTIHEAIARELGVDTMVIVKSAAEMAAVVDGNIWVAQDLNPSRLMVTLTQDLAALPPLKDLEAMTWGGETLHIGPHAAYLWCAEGILQSKAAAALLKGLADTGTTRNWATVQKIHEQLQKP